MMILVGDMGGTKTALALFEARGRSLRLVRDSTAASRAFPTFDAVVGRFFADGPPASIDAACFGVAGPVVDGRATTTTYRGGWTS